LKEQFALSGTAHLLAISGFHVGVVAGLLFTLLRRAGVSRERSALLAAAGSWLYVFSIGAPHAAARAATLVAFFAASRLRGRPIHPAGGLAAAALVMVAVDPTAPASISFQLSFAGAAGLVWLRVPLARGLRSRVGDRIPGGVQDAVVAGVAATLITTPLVAWHFDRISLVGIPATLVVGPLVALAIPGIFAALVLDFAIPPLGPFLAGSVSFILLLVEGVVGWSAGLPGASPWVSRPTLWALVLGATAAALLLRAVPGSRMRPGVRRGVVLAGALSAWVALPLPGRIAGGGLLTLSFLDVGQGDAITLRTPAGRWIVVDTGPRGPGWDAGARVVLPHLRQAGARRIELLILTHPHLDHVGGAEALLRGMEVGRVADPGLPAAGSFYLDLLGLALEDRTGWWPLQAGDSWEVDGVELVVLHPVAGADTLAPSHGANSLSVILEVRFGGFRALLTGDAPAEIEEVLSAAGAISPVQVLKVGHHGSRTSTGWDLLSQAEPEVAIIPAGRGNSFGHPHPQVLERLRRSGARLYRTDQDGTVTIRAQEDGGYRVATGRGNVVGLPQFPDFREGTPPNPSGDSASPRIPR
jgi:competence protein ComEC